MSWLYINNSLYHLKIKTKQGDFILKCSLKILPLALSQFHFDSIKTTKMPFPYEKLSNINNLRQMAADFEIIDQKYHHLSLDEYFELYAKNDCLILKQGLTEFFSILSQLGCRTPTKYNSISAISLNLFIKKYNTIELKLDKYIKNNIRTSYFGGRCEVLGNSVAGEKILHYDYPGMYQQCMSERVPRGPWSTDLNPKTASRPGFYKATVESNMLLPVLPWKNDKLYFPNGRFTGFFWFEELQLFEKMNGVINRLHMAYYPHSYDFYLKNFIEDLMQVRKRGGIYKTLGKLLINSFYGRLGLKDDFDLTYLMSSLTTMQCDADIQNCIKQIKINSNPKSNIAVASAVTSKARIKLYNTLVSIIDAGGRPLYYDTDSVFAAFPIDAKIENCSIGEIIFDTNNESTCITQAIFASSKTYALKVNNSEIIRSKGFNLKIDYAAFQHAFFNEQPLLLDQVFLKKTNLQYCQIYIEKKLTLHKYDKRDWNESKTKTTARTIQYHGQYPYII